MGAVSTRVRGEIGSVCWSLGLVHQLRKLLDEASVSRVEACRHWIDDESKGANLVMLCEYMERAFRYRRDRQRAFQRGALTLTSRLTCSCSWPCNSFTPCFPHAIFKSRYRRHSVTFMAAVARRQHATMHDLKLDACDGCVIRSRKESGVVGREYEGV